MLLFFLFLVFTLTSFSEHIDLEYLSGMAALVHAGKLLDKLLDKVLNDALWNALGFLYVVSTVIQSIYKMSNCSIKFLDHWLLPTPPISFKWFK